MPLCRRFHLAALVALAVPAPMAHPGPRALAAASRPNVLFIAIDDQNDWIGCLGGHPQVRTPHIDRLANRGTLFTNAHCQAPLCNPSRTSLLTGLRPSTTGIYALNPWFRTVGKWRDWVTLPEYFRRHGYRTLAAGKIYHGTWPPPADRHRDWDVIGPAARVGVSPPRKLVETPSGNHPLVDWGLFPHRDDEKGDWITATWAVGQLDELRRSRARHRDDPGGVPEPKPFFLAVGFFLPHVPCYATPRWFELYPEDAVALPPVKADDRDDLPRFASFLHWRLPEPRLAWLEETGQWRQLVRAYLASVSFVDSQVGRVIEALDASGLDGETLVVLWSDHGWHLGEKGITGKNSLWERSTRVPLIFAGPGVAANARCSRPAELLDVYPTLAELCGLPARDGLEGRSLVPQLKDSAAPRSQPAITTHNQNNHAIRTERWRYIQYADGSEELYDESADPNEWRNLASDPAHAGTLRELERWIPTLNADPAPGSSDRLLTFKNGIAIWEGSAIKDDEKMP